MEKIPVVVKVQILSHLSVNEVLKCAVLSKEFYKVTQEEGLWHKLTLRYWFQLSLPDDHVPFGQSSWKKLYRVIDSVFPLKLTLCTSSAQLQPYPAITICSSKFFPNETVVRSAPSSLRTPINWSDFNQLAKIIHQQLAKEVHANKDDSSSSNQEEDSSFETVRFQGGSNDSLIGLRKKKRDNSDFMEIACIPMISSLDFRRIEDFGPPPILVHCPYRAFMGKLVSQLVALKKFGSQSDADPQ
jgi:hypothetical protein